MEKQYQDTVLDYAQEWHSVIRKMMETEVAKTTENHKTVRHYEDKVTKLRKQSHDKEDAGKSPTRGQTDKLQRNEEKLAKAWEGEYHTNTRSR